MTDERRDEQGDERSEAAHAPGHHVVTFLTPSEQQRIDAAGHGCYTTTHRESLEQLLSDLRAQPASAILISVTRYEQQHAPKLARVVREFPRIPAVAVLSATEQRTTHALLSLGQHGARALVDLRQPTGWRDLRTVVTRPGSEEIEQQAIHTLRADLVDARSECLRFLEMLFRVPPKVTTVRQLAQALGVSSTTFMSRFHRAELPPPRWYLAYARLVRAASRLENPGCSVTQIAYQLEYSSPQSFSRHVQNMLGCSAVQFRRRYTGHRMLDAMRERLILPYRDQLRVFDPFATQPQWLVRRVSELERPEADATVRAAAVAAAPPAAAGRGSRARWSDAAATSPAAVPRAA